MIRTSSGLLWAAGLLVYIVLSLMVLPGVAAADSGTSLDVVRDNRDHVVVTTTGGCVRTRWIVASDPCAPGQPQMVAAAAPQHQMVVYVTVEFAFNQSALTNEAKSKLDTLASLKTPDKTIKAVMIGGYADRIGSAAYNEHLSEQRAQAVRDYLTKLGVATPEVTQMRWYGKSKPTTNCDPKLPREKLIDCLAADRKAEVAVQYTTSVEDPAAQGK